MVPPDIPEAFVDMRMPPGWDGIETIENLWRVDPHLQVAICTAYSDYSWEEILQRGYERLVQMDGDGQHPPEEIAALLAGIGLEDTDLVLGSRFLGRAEYQIPWARRLGIRFFGALTGALIQRRVTDPTSGFQAMSRSVLLFYQQDFYPYDYPDADILLRLHYAGLRFEEVPVVMRAGPPGRSMHRGLRPLYYIYKLMLSIGLTWWSEKRRPSSDWTAE